MRTQSHRQLPVPRRVAILVAHILHRYRVGMSQVRGVTDPQCPTCGQPLRRGGHLSRQNAALLSVSGNAGVTFETQGRCENEACLDYGREFAPGEWLQFDDTQE